MTKTKLKWKVSDTPTGPFRSFHKRMWPSATLNGEVAFMIICEDSYEPRRVKVGDHSELRIQVAYRKESVVGWRWRLLKHRAKTLPEAKAVCQKFADTYPNVFINKVGD